MIFSKRKAGWLVIMAMLLVGQPAFAALVDQPAVDDNIGYLSDSSVDIRADNFSLGATYDLTTLTWWGIYENANSSIREDDSRVASDLFTVAFYSLGSSTSLASKTPVVSRAADTSIIEYFDWAPVYQYTVSDIDVSLTAGDYLISIGNAVSATDTQTSLSWYWADSNGGIAGGDGHYYFGQTGSGADAWLFEDDGSDIDLAFTLAGTEVITSDVPSPATTALLLAGLFSLIASRKGRALLRK